jgi:hypothetical protein
MQRSRVARANQGAAPRSGGFGSPVRTTVVDALTLDHEGWKLPLGTDAAFAQVLSDLTVKVEP